MKTSHWLLGSAIVAASIALGSAAHAGPFILSGTDADDHGSATATANLDGWLYMQRAIENLAPAVTNGNKTIYALGSDPNTQAGNAAMSAYKFSSLASTYTFAFVNGADAINAFFAPGGGVSTAALILLDSTLDQVSGGATTSEVAAFTANATAINNYLGGGGGLFAQQESYDGFLNVLLPNVVVSPESNTGITLTSAGSAAFPGLTNADLSAGPYHQAFSNTGNLSVLGVGTLSGSSIILGSAGGTITNPTSPPTSVPEPTTLALLAGGLLGTRLLRRRR